jgi:hypothetical protein
LPLYQPLLPGPFPSIAATASEKVSTVLRGVSFTSTPSFLSSVVRRSPASYVGFWRPLVERGADSSELAEHGVWVAAQFCGPHESLFDSLCECSSLFLRHHFFPLVLIFEVDRNQARTSSRSNRRYLPGRKQGSGFRARRLHFSWTQPGDTFSSAATSSTVRIASFMGSASQDRGNPVNRHSLLNRYINFLFAGLSWEERRGLPCFDVISWELSPAFAGSCPSASASL